MFPRLAELTEIHIGFLKSLKEKQRLAANNNNGIVDSIADLLLDQFSSINAQRLKSAYGEFCSRHRDALDVYKVLEKDPAFFNFIKHCQVSEFKNSMTDNNYIMIIFIIGQSFVEKKRYSRVCVVCHSKTNQVSLIN